jgi:hypothetical protein
MAVVSWNTMQAPHIALQVTSALANNINQLGGALNPSGFLYGSWEFFSQYHVAPTNGGSIDLYLVPAIDDTNYANGDVAVTPPGTTFVGSFPLYSNANSGQRIPIFNVPMTPLTVKPLIKNSSGQTIPANSGTLTVRLYSEKVV